MTNKFKIEVAVILFFFFIALLVVIQSRRSSVIQTEPSHITPTPTIQEPGERTDLGHFSIELPKGWRYEPQTGVDSFVGTFIGDGITLLFDYGYYSNTLAREGDPKYTISYEVIDKRKAKIVRSNVPGQGLTGIYFESVAEISLPGPSLPPDATSSSDRIESIRIPEMPVMLGINGENIAPEYVEKVINIYRSILFTNNPGP